MLKFVIAGALALAALMFAPSIAFAAEPTGIAKIISDVGLPLIAVAVPLAVAALKKLLPSVPSWALPLLAPILGAAGDAVLALLAGVPVTGWQGALAGLAGVGVREVVDQAKKALPS
jgi:hypothetical protein